MCTCVIFSFLFFEDRKALISHAEKTNWNCLTVYFHSSKIVLTEPQKARLPPNVKFIWTLWSFSITVYLKSKFT